MPPGCRSSQVLGVCWEGGGRGSRLCGRLGHPCVISAAAWGGACLESLPILDLVRVYPGRPAAHPTATGWDEELRARIAGVRLPRPGNSESSFRTGPSVCLIMLRHRYR